MKKKVEQLHETDQHSWWKHIRNFLNIKPKSTYAHLQTPENKSLPNAINEFFVNVAANLDPVNSDILSPKSIMLAGPKPAQNLLETCSLVSLRLACVRDRVALSKVHHASNSENLFACMNPIDLT